MKRKNLLKKSLSFALVTALLGSTAPAFAVTTPNAYKVEPVSEVNVFDTFADYSCEYNRWGQNFHPNGWYSGS